MFRGKLGTPAADTERYLPELRTYVKANFECLPDVTFLRIPRETEKHCNTAEKADGGRSVESLPFQPAEAEKNLSLLDSPAMKRYYRSWEKKESVTRTFSSEVMRMVTDQFQKTSDFYVPACIDKRTFHKIRSDYLYRPSKNTALKCCFGLGLNREEAEELLQLAGYALSPSDPSDLVVRFCLEKGIRDLASVNYLLASFDIRDLEGVEPGGML